MLLLYSHARLWEVKEQILLPYQNSGPLLHPSAPQGRSPTYYTRNCPAHRTNVCMRHLAAICSVPSMQLPTYPAVYPIYHKWGRQIKKSESFSKNGTNEAWLPTDNFLLSLPSTSLIPPTTTAPALPSLSRPGRVST